MLLRRHPLLPIHPSIYPSLPSFLRLYNPLFRLRSHFLPPVPEHTRTQARDKGGTWLHWIIEGAFTSETARYLTPRHHTGPYRSYTHACAHKCTIGVIMSKWCPKNQRVFNWQPPAASPTISTLLTRSNVNKTEQCCAFTRCKRSCVCMFSLSLNSYQLPNPCRNKRRRRRACKPGTPLSPVSTPLPHANFQLSKLVNFI